MLKRLTDCIRAGLADDIREVCARQDASRLYAWTRLGALLLILVLAGCERTTQTVTRPTPALAVVCPAECFAECKVTPAARWTPTDPNSGKAWKELIEQTVAGLLESLDRCDTHRKACVGCIETAERSGRICGNVEVCE